MKSFNSLQAGKRIQSPQSISHPQKRSEFQFPSSGKADPKIVEKASRKQIGIVSVSIPFKRESGSKESGEKVTSGDCNRRVSIPFKRESGSKVAITPKTAGDVPFRFNSLQARKADPKTKLNAAKNPNCSCFNSLQAGKRIQSQNCKTVAQLIKVLVSIPFKRESGSKV